MSSNRMPQNNLVQNKISLKVTVQKFLTLGSAATVAVLDSQYHYLTPLFNNAGVMISLYGINPLTKLISVAKAQFNKPLPERIPPSTTLTRNTPATFAIELPSQTPISFTNVSDDSARFSHPITIEPNSGSLHSANSFSTVYSTPRIHPEPVSKHPNLAIIIVCATSLSNEEKSITAALAHVKPQQIFVINCLETSNKELITAIHPQISYIQAPFDNELYAEYLVASDAQARGFSQILSIKSSVLLDETLDLSHATTRLDNHHKAVCFQAKVNAINTISSIQKIENLLADAAKLSQAGGPLYTMHGPILWNATTLLKVLQKHDMNPRADYLKKSFILNKLGSKLAIADIALPISTVTTTTEYLKQSYLKQVDQHLHAFEFFKALFTFWNDDAEDLPLAKLHQLNHVCTLLNEIALPIILASEYSNPIMLAALYAANILPALALKIKAKLTKQREIDVNFAACLLMLPVEVLNASLGIIAALMVHCTPLYNRNEYVALPIHDISTDIDDSNKALENSERTNQPLTVYISDNALSLSIISSNSNGAVEPISPNSSTKHAVIHDSVSKDSAKFHEESFSTISFNSENPIELIAAPDLSIRPTLEELSTSVLSKMLNSSIKTNFTVEDGDLNIMDLPSGSESSRAETNASNKSLAFSDATPGASKSFKPSNLSNSQSVLSTFSNSGVTLNPSIYQGTNSLFTSPSNNGTAPGFILKNKGIPASAVQVNTPSEGSIAFEFKPKNV